VPQSTLERDRVLGLLPVPVTDAQLDDLLFVSKAELEGRDGSSLLVSVTPDRLDLLSEGGLALHLQGALEVAHGLPPIPAASKHEPPVSIVSDPSVDAIRPFVAGVVVRSPSESGIDVGTLGEAIRVQELLHASIGRDRRAASLGIYPFGPGGSPVRYSLEPIDGVRFVPLEGDTEIEGAAFFRDHPMAARYGPLGRVEDRCLTLRDAQGTILSLPPILNGRTAGEARVGDRILLLESTGTQSRGVREALGLLLVVFAARGWSVQSVAIERNGVPIDPVGPISAPRAIELTPSAVRDVTGEALPSGQVEHRLARARLSAKAHSGGWRVEVPPWRPDLLSAVDLVEEVAIAVPLRPEDGILPPSATRGRRRAETVFRRRLATALLGMGLAAPHTSLLVAEASVERWGGPPPIRLLNPVSAELAYLRDRLLLSHLEVLERNTRHGYPQRFGEVGPVLVRQPSAESGGETRYHASLVLASESSGFADGAGAVDYLLRTIDVVAVREPAEIPGTIAGRAARARVAGEPVAEMGEIHPRILSALGVPVPAVWAELDLTSLWTLAGRRDTD
jgi:phenylalanyl-tRNA synthetase beta chain